MPPYAPYGSSAANDLYNLLFCDEPGGFMPKPGTDAATWQTTLFSDPADRAGLRTLAADASQDGRVRYLAWARLRQLGHPVPGKVLLGAIVEVPLAGGLDVLAAYSDGGVRYLNQSGKLAVFEGVAALQPLVHNLLAAAEVVVGRIGPWDKPRRPPPAAGSIRLSFLVSDGLYFGEGPMSVMQGEPMAGPVIGRAVALLNAVVEMGTR